MRTYESISTPPNARKGKTHRGTAVGDTGREGGHAGRLVFTGETELVVLAVDGNVLEVLRLELLDRGFDRGHSLAGRPHLGGREVGVAASTVPVALERLRVE